MMLPCLKWNIFTPAKVTARLANGDKHYFNVYSTNIYVCFVFFVCIATISSVVLDRIYGIYLWRPCDTDNRENDGPISPQL